jgi:hypothetical protein
MGKLKARRCTLSALAHGRVKGRAQAQAQGQAYGNLLPLALVRLRLLTCHLHTRLPLPQVTTLLQRALRVMLPLPLALTLRLRLPFRRRLVGLDRAHLSLLPRSLRLRPQEDPLWLHKPPPPPLPMLARTVHRRNGTIISAPTGHSDEPTVVFLRSLGSAFCLPPSPSRLAPSSSV